MYKINFIDIFIIFTYLFEKSQSLKYYKGEETHKGKVFKNEILENNQWDSVIRIKNTFNSGIRNFAEDITYTTYLT